MQGSITTPSYQDEIEVRCEDGRTKHLVGIAMSVRGMKLVGHIKDQY